MLNWTPVILDRIVAIRDRSLAILDVRLVLLDLLFYDFTQDACDSGWGVSDSGSDLL